MVMEGTVLMAFAVVHFYKCYVLLLSLPIFACLQFIFTLILFCLFVFLHTLNYHRDLKRWLLYLVRLVALCNGLMACGSFCLYLYNSYTITQSVLVYCHFTILLFVF